MVIDDPLALTVANFGLPVMLAVVLVMQFVLITRLAKLEKELARYKDVVTGLIEYLTEREFVKDTKPLTPHELRKRLGLDRR